MFSISHSLLSIALPHVLLTVLISSTCTLPGTPCFPSTKAFLCPVVFASLYCSKPQCYLIVIPSALSLSSQLFTVSVSVLRLRPSCLCLCPSTLSRYSLHLPGSPSPSSSAWLRPTSAPDFDSACSSEPRLSHDHRS